MGAGIFALLGGGVQPEGQTNSGSGVDLLKDMLKKTEKNNQAKETGYQQTISKFGSSGDSTAKGSALAYKLSTDKGFYGHMKVQGMKQDSSKWNKL